MTDPRSLFRQAVPPPDRLDLPAVQSRARRLVRRRRSGVAALVAVTVVATGSAASLVLAPDRDAVLVPATSPSPRLPSPAAEQVVQVFFASFRGDDVRCDDVTAVDREIPPTEAVATAALRELLEGPTEAERATGLDSVFGAETAGLLRSVRIEDRVAYVDFRAGFRTPTNGVGTTCGSLSLLAQLRATLLQLPTVDEAAFAIDGNPLDFYGALEMGCPDVLEDGDRCRTEPFAG